MLEQFFCLIDIVLVNFVNGIYVRALHYITDKETISKLDKN